jgi:hypothetical protein
MRTRLPCEFFTTVTTTKMSSITSDREQLIEETLRLVDEGVYDSIRQATGAPLSTVCYRRASR